MGNHYNLNYLNDLQILTNKTLFSLFLDFLNSFSDVPTLANLTMIELKLIVPEDSSRPYFFNIIDSCPNLKSAYIEVKSSNWYVDYSFRLEYLQDLVFECVSIKFYLF